MGETERGHEHVPDDGAYADGNALTAVFGNNARTKIVAALVSEHDRDVNVSDIARIAGVARSTVYDHLDALQAVDVVKQTRKVGDSPMYQINTDSELVEHIMVVEGLAGRELLTNEPLTA